MGGMYIIITTPFWLSKEWFPDLLQATVDTPRLLMRPDLLQQPDFHHFYDGFHALQLTVWKLSGDSSALRAIPGELRRFWRDLGRVQRL